MTIQNIGRYRILRELGRGTLARVYLARDPASGQQVAVKVLADNYTSAPDFEARFQAEMQVLKALNHPGLIKLIDYGREAGQYFIVGRYLPGGTLADRLEGRPLLLAEVVPILKRLADALDAAHTAGIVHGNLSPANVLFDLHERSFLSDLGLSHLLAPSAGPELSGAPEYMSPEQAQGGAIDGRADVYSLGAMLFEMLTGQRPFAADSAFQLLRQHVEQPVPQLSEAVLARLVLPMEFNQVLARALAKNPDARYPTAGVLAEAVRARFVVPPPDPGATVPVAAALASAGLTSPGAVPPAAPPQSPRAAGAARAGPAIVGELVREPEAPAPRARAMPAILGLGAIVVVLVLLAVWRLPDIAGLFRSRTATPTATATVAATAAVATASPRPSAVPSVTRVVVASATPRASVTPAGTVTRTPSAAPSSTGVPTATSTATSTNTRAPTSTQSPSQAPPTDTVVPPTATATFTAPPPAPTATSAPPPTSTQTAVATVTASLTPTLTPTATISPIPSNTAAPLPN